MIPLPHHIARALANGPSNKRFYFYDKTADYQLKAEHSGSIFSNLGAEAAVTFSLPTNAAGQKGIAFMFVVAAAQELRVEPGGSSHFIIGGAVKTDGLYITANDEGESIMVVSDGLGDWRTLFPSGTWTVEGE